MNYDGQCIKLSSNCLELSRILALSYIDKLNESKSRETRRLNVNSFLMDVVFFEFLELLLKLPFAAWFLSALYRPSVFSVALSSCVCLLCRLSTHLSAVHSVVLY